MRDPDRIDDLLDVIRERWAAEPDLRLGQLLVDALRAARPEVPPMPDLFYVEDDELAQCIASAASTPVDGQS